MPTLPPPKVFCRSTTALETIHQRLDALDAADLSAFYGRLLVLTGFSWAVRTAELVLFTFTRDLIDSDIGMGTTALQTLGMGEFVGAAIGGPLFGYLADYRGRRLALLLAMALSLAGLALSAIATRDYILIIARIVAGAGLGGELPAAIVLVQELSPKSMRGHLVACLEAFGGIGGIVGAALAFELAPQFGWRNTYWIICACGLYTAALRFGIPESPRWLASVGREDEALKAPSTFDKPVHTLALWTLWSAMTLSSYALGVYVPTLISMSGFNMYEGWVGIVLLHGSQIVGCILASRLLRARGHKQALACFATLVSIVAIILSYAPWNCAAVVVGTCSVSLLLAGAWSCVLAYSPSNYRTAVRARGVSYAFGFSRLAAAGGLLLYPHMFNVWLMSVSSIIWVFTGLLAATVLGFVVPWGFNAPNYGYCSIHEAPQLEIDP
ncbi:hypothetical protein PHYSODRAFT_313700 [Phytophthora sojae]|uniref:Major facilitator superfamily (MFS) profile domain-containing protein n=1 Tax=Phytophthora sojae (strain P6497) TaxID=1094619 RepID=G4Z416_PHYSP|nr:hypothetical protein PHYSODRAFT_313700 [Phytophthora sojae]EGZ21568.1 hypothetical protein PHYSODRAFT_313700 [Phytophthora sojae]|eukprot:XP_009524285.1 hypothetical protein PHYSODRAFT_313700 [Phytophthora sojae]